MSKAIDRKEQKLIFFDLDGTLVSGYEYIWQHLWIHFGVELEISKKRRLEYLNGKLSYKNWVDHDVKLLKSVGATKDSIIAAIQGGLRLTKGAIEVVHVLKDRGYKIFVLSGSIDVVLDIVIPDHSEIFEEVFINRFIFTQEGELAEAIPTPYDEEHKATAIKNMSKKYGVPMSHCVFIGDNQNDVRAAVVAGTSIAFMPKSDELVDIADHIISEENLTKVLSFVS